MSDLVKTELNNFLTLSSLVFVHDPTDSDDNVIPIGKQTLNPSHIFYRPCSGIWQSVWIESAPANYITELQLSAGADGTGKSDPDVFLCLEPTDLSK